jgi:uncharacterized membrane protein YvbJ
MFCSSCGEKILDQALICVKCGCATPNYQKPKEKFHISKGMLLLHYAVSIFMPFIGVIVAIVLLFKGRIGHAIALGIISVVMWIFWMHVLSH